MLGEGRKRPQLTIIAQRIEAISSVDLRPQRLLANALAVAEEPCGTAIQKPPFAMKHHRASIFGKPRMPFLMYRKV